MARENSDWGYDRIAGALEKLGYKYPIKPWAIFYAAFGIAPAPKRRLQMRGAHFARLGNYYVLFFLNFQTRRVTLAGITQNPTEERMLQMACRAVDPIDGALLPVRLLLHDRDSKFCAFCKRHISVGRRSTSQAASP
jgi:hypothetical protein